MLYAYYFLTNKKEVEFYAYSRVEAEGLFQERFGFHPEPFQFIRREKS